MKLEDLKVGQYVRFKDKRGIEYIRKIVEIPEDNRYASLYLDKEANYSRGLSPKNIIKEPSFNVIDILEEGDYVNGYIVEEIKRGYDGKIWIDNGTRGYDEGGEYIIWKRNEDIKSIVTHEQMEQMAYKVEE